MKHKPAAPVYTESRRVVTVFTCPPHHWLLESPAYGSKTVRGRCRKCGDTAQFATGFVYGQGRGKVGGPKKLLPESDDT